MMQRISKALLVGGIAFYYTLAVFNNCADYAANYQFVRHVMLMDSTFRGNPEMWRAVHSTLLQKVFYDGIILWEAATMVLCWLGCARMLRSRTAPATAFQQAGRTAVAGLTLGLLMWLIAFLSVGGEWFLMWQSPAWNGQQAAFRMFAVLGIVLLLVAMPEREIWA